MDRKTKPIWFMKYSFLNQDRINCFSFFNEISKRIFIYPIYTFGCYRYSYHGVFPTFCANRFPLTKHLLGLINFTILGFQQEVLTGQFDDTFHGWFSAVMFLLAFVFIVNTLSILVCSRKRRWDGLWPYVSLVILTNVSVYLRSEVIVCFSLLQKKKILEWARCAKTTWTLCFLRSLHKTILVKGKTFEHWSTWSFWTVFVPFPKKTL